MGSLDNGTSGRCCSQSTGNDVSGHYFRHYFLLFFSFFIFSPPSRPFLIEGVLVSKNLFSESCLKWPITLGWTPFQTPSAILGPPGGHFGFCRRCGVAGGERVPLAPLGWYSFPFLQNYSQGVQDFEQRAILFYAVFYSFVKNKKNTSLAAPWALAHRLQRRTACKTQNGRQGAPKWPTGSGKGSNPRLLAISSHFC